MAGLLEYQKALSAYQEAHPIREVTSQQIVELESQSALMRAGLTAEQQNLYALKHAARVALLEKRGLGWCSFSHTGQFIGGWEESDPRGIFPLAEMRWVYEQGLALPHYNSMSRIPMTMGSRDGQLFFTCPLHYTREFEWGHNRVFSQSEPIHTEGVRSDVEKRGKRLFAIYPELKDVTEVQKQKPRFVPDNLDTFLDLALIPALVLP